RERGALPGIGRLLLHDGQRDRHRRRRAGPVGGRARPAQRLRPAGTSWPHGSLPGRSGVNSRTRPTAPARVASIVVRSAEDSSSSAPASLASTSAGVRAPTSAVLTAGLPSTQASAIWLRGTPRGSATSRRRRSATPTLVLRFSPRKIG